MTDAINGPLISIITVTKDNLAGLTRTAKNIQVQTFTDYEWIVVDGLSEDGTAEYLATLQNAKIIREKDSGIYDAMNKGIDAAKGEYLIFMNAGDVFGDRFVLGKISEALQQQRPDFLYGDALESSGFYKRALGIGWTSWGMITHHQAMVYRRDKLKKMRYDTSLKIAADYGFTMRFLRNAKKIHYLPLPLCVFEDGGISQRNQKEGRLEQFSIRRGTGTPGFYNMLILWGQTATSLLKEKFPDAYYNCRSLMHKRLG